MMPENYHRPARNRELQIPMLIRSLTEPDAYPHPVRDLKIIETHISWVILTGPYAYKIKKPVALGFLDFSTLRKRKFFCEEELRLNRRTAPELYLDVAPVGRVGDGLKIGVEPAVDYAVRMRQFPGDARLDQRLEADLLGPADMTAMAAMLARFHQSLPPRENIDPAFATNRAAKPALNNFSHLPRGMFDKGASRQLADIEAWTLRQISALEPVFAARARNGFIRECHGDLHLANLLVLGDQFVPFDCIEFNPELRWIDTASDIAFLVMDLMAHGRADLAYLLLSAWLEENGDYGSLEVMRFYLVYRCMVRVIVASIRHMQCSAEQHGERPQDNRQYLDLALSLVNPLPPRLYLMHGFSGSGKTWLSNKLVAGLPALRVRSDLERKRLSGLTTQQRGADAIESGLYSRDVTDRTYRVLAGHCETGLRAGFNMIADATFLRRRHRRQFFDLAAAVAVEPVICDCSAPLETLKSRILQRAAGHADASDADLAVLEYQISNYDPLSERERLFLDTEQGREPVDHAE